MSEFRTTIILGAGASVHYGFPTGEGLIDLIIDSSKWHNWYMIGGDYYLDELWHAKTFSNRLKNYDPISIDRFLSMYQEDKKFVEIGKKLISHVIVKCQSAYKSTRNNKENWYKHLYDFIFNEEDFDACLKNDRFQIITFNYDLSLEHFFHSRLENTPNISSEKAWEIFKNLNEKIFHVYGSVYDYVETDVYGKSSQTRYEGLLRYAEKASHSNFEETSYCHNNIKIIGEERNFNDKKLKNVNLFTQASDRIFILGFGFDDMNLKLLNLNYESISNFKKRLFITNYKNNKIVSSKINNLVRSNHYNEISGGTVYDALVNDFNFNS